MTPVLEMEDVRVRYPARGLGRWRRGGGAEIVSGVSLRVGRGQTLGLVGESGSGKTSLARAVVGLVGISGGVVRIDGRSAAGPRDRGWQFMRRDVGMMFQDPVASLDPRMSILASVAEPLAVHGGPGALWRRDRWDVAGRMLERVGLERRLFDRYPHQISGGQARRVAVARALVLRPKLVIADEPTAGLDVSVQGEVLNLLLEMQAAFSLSYLIITHNLAVARHMSDRIAVMHRGRIVEEGAAEDVYMRPGHLYTRGLVGQEERVLF